MTTVCRTVYYELGKDKIKLVTYFYPLKIIPNKAAEKPFVEGILMSIVGTYVL